MSRRLPLFSVALLAGLAAARPATQPTAVVKLDDAVPLERFQDDNIEANLTQKLDAPEAARELYFGEVDRYENDDADTPINAVPILAVHDGDAWKAVPLAGPGLTDAGFKFVGSGPGANEIWAVLDTAAGDSRGSVVLAHSTDGGKTLRLTPLRKPCKKMSFFDFAMDKNGIGRLSLSLDEACGNHAPGLYHQRTRDGGKSWSTPFTFEADDLHRADPVPDDEQPSAPDGPGRSKTLGPGVHQALPLSAVMSHG